MRPFTCCPVCHGIHQHPPTCLGRPQTETEWMVDRGVRPERAAEIVAARARTGGLPSMVPGQPATSPNNVPLPATAEPDQGALF